MSQLYLFRIILPYGFERNEAGQWSAFNREYAPLGMTEGRSQSLAGQLPNYHNYEGLTDSLIRRVIDPHDAGAIQVDTEGKINRFFLYNDATNPTSCRKEQRPHLYADYFRKLQLLSDGNHDAYLRHINNPN